MTTGSGSAGPVLIDTDILIDYLRGQPEARTFLQSLVARPMISEITVAELYSGVREGAERVALDALVSTLDRVNVDGPIAIQGGLFRRDYRKSHNIGLADALIAGTVENLGATLATLNQKHFPMLSDVIVPYQKL